MSNEWDEYAEGWDDDASLLEYANKAFQELSRIVDLDGLSVLDFGCGTGSLTALLSPRVKDVVALDGSSEMIRHLTKKNLSNVSSISDFLSQELIERHPLLSHKFDLIVASSVCSFLPDYEMTLGLLRSLLKNGGMFIQWDWLANDDTSETGMSEKRVVGALNKNGFVEVQVKSPFEMTSSKGLLPVLMAIGKCPS